MKKTSLETRALEIRRRFLKMHFDAGSGHIGVGLSSIDLLTYLYFEALKNPASPGGDRFVLSKGHAASALYATLAQAGIFSDSTLQTYYQESTLLPAHPAPQAFAAIPAATGSLGHGLPITSGMAYAAKYLKPSTARVFCLISDGECNEGSTWEGALFAAHHALENLTVIIDANGLQGFGSCKDVLNTEPLAAKWQSFGFVVAETPGHDFEKIHQAFQTPHPGKPLCVLARTVKGKGVSFMENKMEWHYLPMKEAQYRQALSELQGAG